MEINGVAHLILTVRDLERSRPFYEKLLPLLGMTRIVNDRDYLYYVGGRTALGLRPAAPDWASEPFAQGRCGLHHVCFRARARDHVDSVHEVMSESGALVVHAPQEAGWVPGYYSVLLEDPDGIRIEVNFVPGKGVFDSTVKRLDQPEPR